MQKYGIVRSRLLAIKSRLDEISVPWVVFAGAAAYCYGSLRDITDIDILVKSEDLGKAEAALKDIDTKGFDIVSNPDFPLDREMIERAQRRELLGVLVPLIPVEDNIVLKAILQRGKDQGKHDMEDIESMIRIEKIDLGYLEKRAWKLKCERKVKALLEVHGLRNPEGNSGPFRVTSTCAE